MARARVKATDKQFPALALKQAGYGSLWRGESLWNGVAILGKDTQPIETRRALPGQETDPHARYLEAAIHGVLVGDLYPPNGNPVRGPKFTYKLAWFESLITHALIQPQTRACYTRLLAQGWLDALRARHPDERIYTFWDYFREHWKRNAGLRIDHLLLNAELAPKLVDAGVDTWVRDRPHASDHAPTWITIDTSAHKPVRKRVRASARR